MSPTVNDTRPWSCPRTNCPAKRSHDTSGAYRAGCRSGAATDAHRLYWKRWREGRNPPGLIDATPVRRRLQALAAIGHRTCDIGRVLGVSEYSVQHWMRAANVTQKTSQRVNDVYEQLQGRPGVSEQGRRRARSKGWAPPLAWDDIDNLDERPNTGRDRGGAERVSHTADIARLTRAGRSVTQIADQLGITRRSVERARARIAARAGKEAA